MSQGLEALNQLLDQTVTDFAFMFLEPLSDRLPEPPAGQGLVQAWISFYPPEGRGSLGVLAGRDFCQELAQNILGCDSVELGSEEVPEQALCELLNVLGGKLVAELYGREQHIPLSIPESRPADRQQWADWQGAAGVQPAIVDGHALIWALKTGRAND
jgi:hypothetical protein